VVATWISEAQAERDKVLEGIQPDESVEYLVSDLGTEEISAILDQLGDLVAALGEAEPDHKQDVYRNVELRLTYKCLSWANVVRSPPAPATSPGWPSRRARIGHARTPGAGILDRSAA
jgi:hypothetical protein